MALQDAWLILKRTRTSDGSVPFYHGKGRSGYIPHFGQASQDAQGQAQIAGRNLAATHMESVADEIARKRPLLIGRKKSKEEEERLRNLANEARYSSGVQQRNIDAGRERGHQYSREKMPPPSVGAESSFNTNPPDTHSGQLNSVFDPAPPTWAVGSLGYLPASPAPTNEPYPPSRSVRVVGPDSTQ